MQMEIWKIANACLEGNIGLKFETPLNGARMLLSF